MLKELVRFIFNRIGLELTRKTDRGKLTKDRVKSEKIISIVRDNTMVSHSGLLSLHYQTLSIERCNIEGDFVECGTWKGGSVGLMALTNLMYGGKKRHLHLFDSFTDICEPDKKIDGDRAVNEVNKWSKNGDQTKGRLVPVLGFYDDFGGHGTVKECIDLLENNIGYDSQYVHIYEGWFQDTIPSVSKDIKKIAILRIDADWYRSTKICLDYLFDKVVSGGFIIIDDYGAYDGCKKAVDEFLDFSGQSLFLNYVNKEIRYMIKK